MPAPYAMPLHRFCQACHTVHLCAMTLGTLSLKLPWQMMLETLQSQQSYPSETRLSNMVCFSPTDRALNLLASQNAYRPARPTAEPRAPFEQRQNPVPEPTQPMTGEFSRGHRGADLGTAPSVLEGFPPPLTGLDLFNG